MLYGPSSTFSAWHLHSILPSKPTNFLLMVPYRRCTVAADKDACLLSITVLFHSGQHDTLMGMPGSESVIYDLAELLQTVQQQVSMLDC